MQTRDDEAVRQHDFSDPCSARCLPHELCERILRLLDVRSLLACAAVSRHWRYCVSVSGAWQLHAARLGLPAEPSASLAQRVALLAGAQGGLAAVRVEIENETAEAASGMAWCERLLSAHYDREQLQLLLYDPELNRARICRLRVATGGINGQGPVSMQLGRHAVLLRRDWQSSSSLLLPLLGIAGGVTWPMFELDSSVTSLLTYPCACGHRRLVCAAGSRLLLWSLPPLAAPTAEVPSARWRHQAELLLDFPIEGLAYLDAPGDTGCRGDQLAVVVTPSAATLVRVSCQSLQRLHRLASLSAGCLNIRSLPGCFNTVEELLEGGEFSGYLRVTRHWISQAGGAISVSDWRYRLQRHRLHQLLQFLDLESHFLLLFPCGQAGGQQAALLFRYGAEQLLLELTVPSVSRPVSGCGLRRTAVVREPVPWRHGLDPSRPCLPLYLSFPSGTDFELLQWRLGLQDASAAAGQPVKMDATAASESGKISDACVGV